VKKFLIGCGVVVVLIVGVAVIGGVFVFRQFKGVGERFKNLAVQVEAIDRQFPFTPPADRLLKEDRLVVWLGVLKQHRQDGDQFGKPDPRQGGFKMAQAMMTAFPRLGEQLTQHLKAVAMSMEEYRWILGQVVGTLHSGDAQADASLKPMVSVIESQAVTPQGDRRMDNQLAMLAAPVTSQQITHNVQLLKKHEKEFLAAGSAISMDGMLMGMTQGMSARGRASRSPVVLPSAPAPAAATHAPARLAATPMPAAR